jgi:hypothetical protein
MDRKKPGLDGTWPLFEEQDKQPHFPPDPSDAFSSSSPGDDELLALGTKTDFPEEPGRIETETRRTRGSLPPGAPEWMRAARTLANWLEARISAGQVSTIEQAAIARTWAAYALGGATESQVLRVAHLVGRAHTAIREAAMATQSLQLSFQAAAGVLHSGLPTSIRERMPVERAHYVVRKIRDEADAWAAIVEGTTELLGWKDYARVHAASIIRAVIEQGDGR